MKTLLYIAAAGMISVSGAALAAPVSPIEYQMQNGQGSGIGGSFSYRDESYDGPGAPVGSELANLTGGTGDLTDGVIATQNWNSGGQTTSTPYVAWFSIDPRITFNFAQIYAFNSVTFHFDASYQGGVAPPTRIEVNDSVTSSVAAPPGSAPFSHTIDLMGVTATDTLTFDIFRATNRWVFLSEVRFDAEPAPAVPLPATGVMLFAALGGFAAMRRLKRG